MIETVLGPIAPEELGLTDTHTHLSRDAGPLVDGDRKFLLADLEKAVEEALLFREAGGRAVVDMMPAAPGRNVDQLVEISRRSGVHIVTATGFVEWALYPGSVGWLREASIDEIAGWIVSELRDGVDAHNYTGPLVRRMKSRPGVIKIATGLQVITPFQEKLIRAACRAHRQTGVPISAHTEQGTAVFELLRLLEQESVLAEAVLLAHFFANDDAVFLRELAATGLYLIEDGAGKIHHGPDSRIQAQVELLLEAGAGKRLLLAADQSKNTYWKSYGGGPGFDYLPGRFVPRLREQGIPQEILQDILVKNPARALSRRPVS